MKALVETTPLYTSRAGVARYVRGLLSGLETVAPAMGVSVETLGWPMTNHAYRQPTRAVKTLLREWGWAKLVAPLQTRGADVLHHTGLPMIPLAGTVRQVVTLHDLAALRHPERYRTWQQWTGLRRLRRVARADRVIAVSQFTADEAMQLLDLPARRITVIHHGVTLAAREDVLPDLPPEFFLFVGSLEPGKNLTLLRQIWLAAVEQGRPLPPLLVVGVRWRGVATEGAAPPGWRFLGHQSDEVLLALYRRARALLFPSIYEGFGLPVIEAMAAGCPVICGRVASLPEVAGEAAIHAELNAADFAAAIARLRSDDALAKDTCAAGRRRAADFSWEKCARETIAVYRAGEAGG